MEVIMPLEKLLKQHRKVDEDLMISWDRFKWEWEWNSYDTQHDEIKYNDIHGGNWPGYFYRAAREFGTKIWELNNTGTMSRLTEKLKRFGNTCNESYHYLVGIEDQMESVFNIADTVTKHILQFWNISIEVIPNGMGCKYTTFAPIRINCTHCDTSWYATERDPDVARLWYKDKRHDIMMLHGSEIVQPSLWNPLTELNNEYGLDDEIYIGYILGCLTAEEIVSQHYGMDTRNPNEYINALVELGVGIPACHVARLKHESTNFDIAYKIVWYYKYINGKTMCRCSREAGTFDIYSQGKCICTSTKVGEELDIRRKNIKSKNIFKGYGECQAAISHCWGDRMLVDDTQNDIQERLSQIGKDLWLDIAQTEEFNAIKCRQEYSDKVYVVEKMTYYCEMDDTIHKIYDGNTSISKNMYVLAMSDWASRGWVAQEMTSANSILLVTEFDVHNVTQFVKLRMPTAFGIMTSELDYLRLITISNRIWRFSDDIWLTTEWWLGCSQAKAIESENIRKTILNGMLTTNLSRPTVRQNFCWWPTMIVDMQPSWPVDINIEDGVLILTGMFSVVNEIPSNIKFDVIHNGQYLRKTAIELYTTKNIWYLLVCKDPVEKICDIIPLLRTGGTTQYHMLAGLAHGRVETYKAKENKIFIGGYENK